MKKVTFLNNSCLGALLGFIAPLLGFILLILLVVSYPWIVIITFFILPILSLFIYFQHSIISEKIRSTLLTWLMILNVLIGIIVLFSKGSTDASIAELLIDGSIRTKSVVKEDGDGNEYDAYESTFEADTEKGQRLAHYLSIGLIVLGASSNLTTYYLSKNFKIEKKHEG